MDKEFPTYTTTREGLAAIPATHGVRRTWNLLPPTERTDLVGQFTTPGGGTGTAVQTVTADANGVRTSSVVASCGTSGRAIWSRTLTLTPKTWYAFSFNVTAKSATLGAGNAFYLTSTALIDRGDPVVSNDDIDAGGVGRYCVTFYTEAGGDILPRLGVGTFSAKANDSLTIQDIQLEVIDPANGFICSEYVFPSMSGAFDYYANLMIDENKKVTESANDKKYFRIPDYSNILALGDSRSDEVNDAANSLNYALGGFGNVQIHARGGWSTGNLLSYDETINTNDYEYRLSKALDGELLKRVFSTGGDEGMSTNQGVPFNTLLLNNLGVNDVQASGYDEDTTMANINTICQAALVRGMKIIITDNNPWNASGTWSSEDGAALKALDKRLMNYAHDNGHLFVSIRDALADSSDPDKLSDGADESPDMSQDGLHPDSLGAMTAATVIANKILDILNIQKVRIPLQTTLQDVSTISEAYLIAPCDGRITYIGGILGGAIGTANVTLTASIDGTAITGGALTFPFSSSAAGDKAFAYPYDEFDCVVQLGDVIKIATNGASSNTVSAPIMVVIEPFFKHRGIGL